MTYFNKLTPRFSAYSLLVLIGKIALIIGLQTKSVLGQSIQFREPNATDQLVTKANKFVQQKEFDQAIFLLMQALTNAKKNSYLDGEAHSNHLLGHANTGKKNYMEGLKFYLSALKQYEILKNDAAVIEVLMAIGAMYQQQQAYQQAITYYEQGLRKIDQKEEYSDLRPGVLENLAYSHAQMSAYAQALQYKSKVLSVYKQQNNVSKIHQTYKELANLSEVSNNYKLALQYNKVLAEEYEKNNDWASLSTIYNNLGSVYKRTNDLKLSHEYFNKAIALLGHQLKTVSETDKAIILTNAGVANTNLKSYSKAKENYLEALRIWEKQKNSTEVANAYNYIAGNDYVSGNTSRAIKSVTSAIKTGESVNAESVLVTSYKILSMIYLQDRNESKAKFYQQKYAALNDKLVKQENLQKQQLLQRQSKIETTEEEMRVLLSEQERQDLENERKENELQLREKELQLKANELAILKRDQQLQSIRYKNQQLEKERTEQALALAQQQIRTEQEQRNAENKSRQIELLEKQKQLHAQILKRKELEEEQQQKAIQFKDQQLNYGYWIFGLLGLILIIIIISLIQKRKSNKLLTAQQYEISAKNEELLVSMEKIQFTQKMLSAQNNQLALQHNKITSSIEYAQRIQNSILPSETLRYHLFPDHFIIYLPKDIVSGDFYWMVQQENKKVIMVVDCTGHGVPGALMSIVGSNILSELVSQRKMTNPAQILSHLHENIRIKLNQKESNNHDGMDIGICVLEPVNEGKVKLAYAGAKHTLYVIKRNQQVSSELLSIEGTRKSIGGANTDQLCGFSTTEVDLHTGDLLYLTTDGFIDQNNPKRVRFNKERFKGLIQQVHVHEMPDQKSLFEQALLTHQQEAEQRDDITLVGIKI